MGLIQIQRGNVLVVTATLKKKLFLFGKTHNNCRHLVHKKGGQDSSVFQIIKGPQTLH